MPSLCTYSDDFPIDSFCLSPYNPIIGQKTFHFSSDVLDIKVVVNPSEGLLYSEVCDC